MTLTFVSNYINHHQIPLSNELYRLLGTDYTFIQTEPIEAERLQMGWQEETRELPYLRLFYEEPEYCEKLILSSDVVVFGGTDEESYIRPRLAAGKLILRYSERIYKSGQWKMITPRGLKKKYEDHTRYRKAPVYLLCAGGYVASDFHLVRAYPDKMFRWGYFPETKHLHKGTLLEKHKEGIVSLLWAGRFLDWKHPELPILLAEYLRKKGYAFHLTMAGGGEMEEEIRNLIKAKKLEKEVTLCGYRKPAEVREMMEQAQVYLITSDYKEGWGAVLNEAMNSGCAVLASHAIGAAPFLLRQGENGLIFRSGNLTDLAEKTELLLRSVTERKRLGDAAYETILRDWNAEKAADRLVKTAAKLLGGTGEDNVKKDNFSRENTVQNIETFAYKTGPLSAAEVISPRRMYRYMMHIN